VCLLGPGGPPPPAALLERSYDRFCFALQCLDDAMDCEEDERTRGTSVPEVLGLPESVLVRALPPLLESAIQLAEQARLMRLATWMRGFATLVGGIRLTDLPADNAHEGRRLAAAAEDIL
jgi:hypothetical protein